MESLRTIKYFCFNFRLLIKYNNCLTSAYISKGKRLFRWCLCGTGMTFGSNLVRPPSLPYSVESSNVKRCLKVFWINKYSVNTVKKGSTIIITITVLWTLTKKPVSQLLLMKVINIDLILTWFFTSEFIEQMPMNS